MAKAKKTVAVKDLGPKIVKYKLNKFGNGYVTPPEIFDGGIIWSQTTGIENMILVGKTNIDTSKTLPEGLLEVITQEQLDAQLAQHSTNALNTYKAARYAEECDPLFFEALREKELGNDTKWKAYVDKCNSIKSLTSIPTSE